MRAVFFVSLALSVLSVLTVLSLTGHAVDLPVHGKNTLPESAQAAVPQFDATNLHESTELGTTWLLHSGDDPSFSRTDFDDRQWIRFDSRKYVKGVLPDARPDVLWYRLHVRVNPAQRSLALVEHQLSSAFEIYVNGQRILQNGQVAPFIGYTFGARKLLPIPDAMTATGSLVIALRVHISRTEWATPGPGFAAENLMLGQQSALQEHIWLSIIGNGTAGWVIQFMALGLGIVALVIFNTQRRQFEYLWIFLQFFCTFCLLPSSLFASTHNFPATWDIFPQLLVAAAFVFEILMFLAFLRVRPGWWTRALFIVSTAGLALSAIGLSQGSISIFGAILGQFPLLFLVAGVLPVVLILHMRRGNREAGILLIPVVLSSLSIYAGLVLLAFSAIPRFSDSAVRWNNVLINLHLGPFVVSLQQLGVVLYLLSLAIIMVQRSTRMSRQQAMLESEVAAAREVQQVILPEKTEAIPGFTIESVYEPAQQVGGDFFQILPTGDGGLLLVLGDVAGKGLPAAILVSVMVGAIRATADYTHQPQELLASLNERLVGRCHGGFSTALAAHITANGQVTLSNAGHLSPYLDGQEIELSGALPLGIVSGVSYECSQLNLPPGSRLTFYSDGVIEAQNEKGELFGFARGQQLSTQSAVNIAQAAKQFGQSDDITVVAIQRNALLSGTT